MYPALFLVVLLALPQAGPAVAVTLDRSWYMPGEEVTITITVLMTDNPTNMSWLWLYIDKPDLHNAYFTQLDPVNQTVIWQIPEDAADGTYTVIVTWDHRYTQTDIIVQAQPIPEFPVPLLVLMIATAATLLAILRRQASARTETATAHS